ncbi:MAG: ATP-binding protein [Halothiobacillaceae bacterium]|nr:ATP-binding protein [Halothiobacillaceae bacterium]
MSLKTRTTPATPINISKAVRAPSQTTLVNRLVRHWIVRLIEWTHVHADVPMDVDERLLRFIGLPQRLLGAALGLDASNAEYLAALRALPAYADDITLDALPRVSRNFERFGALAGLSRTQERILAAFHVLYAHPQMERILIHGDLSVNQRQIHSLIAMLIDARLPEVKKALSQDGRLIESGLCMLQQGALGLDVKLSLNPALLHESWTEEALTQSRMLALFFEMAPKGAQSLADYPHLSRHTNLLLDYLHGVLLKGVPGCNILVYGPPGVGKTSYVQALADTMGANLAEVVIPKDKADQSGYARLMRYMTTQTLLEKVEHSMVMFDEIEDVFSDEGMDQKKPGKLMLNRILEQNPIPTFWISNSIDDIDPAFLRRFDYSIAFPLPTRAVRRRMIDQHMRGLGVSEDWKERMAGKQHLTPAQLEKAARIARLSTQERTQDRESIATCVIEASATLLQQPGARHDSPMATGYSLEFVRTDIEPERIIEGLRKRPVGNLCFYGPPGTGKTALARHIADRIERPLLIKRASDILSPWVGVAEKAMASMFEEASDEEAVLVLDEADSLLSDRRNAQANWQVSQVNEMLVQMESFEGLFICTTNLMQNLDAASLRRFGLKVQFQPLTRDQRLELFLREANRLGMREDIGMEEVSVRLGRLDALTPGDVAASLRKLAVIGQDNSQAALLGSMEQEHQTKIGDKRAIGFTQ